MRLLLNFIFIFTLSQELWARPPAPEWSLHLNTEMNSTYFPEEYGVNTSQSIFNLELNPIFKWKYVDSWRITLSPTLISSMNNKSEEERTFVDAGEAFIRYQKETYSIQIGSNIFSWGITDGYNPLDNINSKQYFNPLKSKKLGALSVVFSQNIDQWDYDLILIPKNRGATLPGTNSRWLPREVFIPQTSDNHLVLKLPPTLSYSYDSTENLDNALDNNFAARIQRRGSAIDFGISLFEGVASFPLIQPQVTGAVIEVSPKTVIQVDPDIRLKPKNYRIRQGGLTFTSQQWDFLFKYATAYTQRIGENTNIPGWTHENVLGLEKNFTLGDSGFLIAILQHSFIYSEKINDSNFSYTEIFRRAWMVGGRITWKEVWNLSLLSLYDQSHGSHYEEWTLGRRLWDVWLVSLGGSLINGNSDTPLGVYDKNDTYNLSISRSF